MEVFKNIKYDLPASIVVFFVAVPLCLGVALASGAPLFAGIVAGIVGGIVVGMCSGSAIGVSGPAAGLASIVLGSLALFNHSWEAFLLAVVIAGILQVIAGFMGGGLIAYYFPSAVIKGMLTGIGIIIVIKQIPYGLGYNSAAEPLLFDEENHQHLLAAFSNLIHYINPGVVLITAVSLLTLILWEKVLTKKHKIFRLIQGPLVVVLLGILLNWSYRLGWLPFSLEPSQLVNVPVPDNFIGFLHQFTFPDFTQITNPAIYKVAFTIAIIASLETLLSVEAADKLDPFRRITPTNRELKAQGIGNILSGLIGGLPVTQVIVRSSANVTFGARTKLSTILHGIFILISALTIPGLLNMIPLGALAAILFVVGYKLAKPALFLHMYKLGWEHFIPFIATIIGIVYFDLLVGVGIGMAIGVFIILRNNYLNSHHVYKTTTGKESSYYINLAEEVSFLNKGSILNELNAIPSNSYVMIDGSKSKIIDLDVKEIIQNFVYNARHKDIKVELKGISNVDN